MSDLDNEKMKILNMLENGLINATECAKLLEALNKGTGARNENTQAPPPRHASHTTTQTPFEQLTNQLSKKFGTIAKDLKPSISSFIDVVTEKTNEFAGKLSDNIEKINAEHAKYSTITKSFEYPVPQSLRTLSLKAFMAPLNIKGYNGTKFSVQVVFAAKSPNASIELAQNNENIALEFDPANFFSVQVNAHIPSSMVYEVYASNIDGSVSIADLSCRVGTFENLNGAVLITNIDIERLKITNENGEISANISGFNNFQNYTFTAETSNARIALNVPSNASLGYFLRAQSPLGNVQAGLLGLEFTSGNQSNIEAKSLNYELKDTKVDISLETSNANITIN